MDSEMTHIWGYTCRSTFVTTIDRDFTPPFTIVKSMKIDGDGDDNDDVDGDDETEDCGGNGVGVAVDGADDDDNDVYDNEY